MDFQVVEITLVFALAPIALYLIYSVRAYCPNICTVHGYSKSCKRDCMIVRCVDMTDWTDSSVITIFSTTSKSAFLDKNSRTYFAKNPVEVTT